MMQVRGGQINSCKTTKNNYCGVKMTGLETCFCYCNYFPNIREFLDETECWPV